MHVWGSRAVMSGGPKGRRGRPTSLRTGHVLGRPYSHAQKHFPGLARRLSFRSLPMLDSLLQPVRAQCPSGVRESLTGTVYHLIPFVQETNGRTDHDAQKFMKSLFSDADYPSARCPTPGPLFTRSHTPPFFSTPPALSPHPCSHLTEIGHVPARLPKFVIVEESTIKSTQSLAAPVVRVMLRRLSVEAPTAVSFFFLKRN